MASGLPSVGRPRCEQTITAAPFSNAILMVGKLACRRASLATLPSLIGTFKSSRINTTLSAKLSSLIRKKFITCSYASSMVNLQYGCLLTAKRFYETVILKRILWVILVLGAIELSKQEFQRCILAVFSLLL